MRGNKRVRGYESDGWVEGCHFKYRIQEGLIEVEIFMQNLEERELVKIWEKPVFKVTAKAVPGVLKEEEGS